MFLFHPIQFFKFLVKSQPQRSYEKGSYKKECTTVRLIKIINICLNQAQASLKHVLGV